MKNLLPRLVFFLAFSTSALATSSTKNCANKFLQFTNFSISETEDTVFESVYKHKNCRVKVRFDVPHTRVELDDRHYVPMLTDELATETTESCSIVGDTLTVSVLQAGGVYYYARRILTIKKKENNLLQVEISRHGSNFDYSRAACTVQYEI